MGIEIKLNKDEEVDETERNESPKTWFEGFSKRWEIATERIKRCEVKPTVRLKETRQGQNFRHDSHSFVYLGGKKRNDECTEVYSDRE